MPGPGALPVGTYGIRLCGERGELAGRVLEQPDRGLTERDRGERPYVRGALTVLDVSGGDREGRVVQGEHAHDPQLGGARVPVGDQPLQRPARTARLPYQLGPLVPADPPGAQQQRLRAGSAGLSTAMTSPPRRWKVPPGLPDTRSPR